MAAAVVAVLAVRAETGFAENGVPAAIERIKPSIVAVGTFERLRSPAFRFAGTGFAVDGGRRIATNAHVLPKELNHQRNETLAIAIRATDGSMQIRAVRKAGADPSHDLAVLEFDGPPLPFLPLGDSKKVREGQMYLITGFPIGAVLGLYPVTHRAMVASVTPIAIPAARAEQLDPRAVRRLTSGSFQVFQLDGTAYPGNSGSPLYDPDSGEVVGIVNSVLVKATKESALSQPSGITYAIPAAPLRALLDTVR